MWGRLVSSFREKLEAFRSGRQFDVVWLVNTIPQPERHEHATRGEARRERGELLQRVPAPLDGRNPSSATLPHLRANAPSDRRANSEHPARRAPRRVYTASPSARADDPTSRDRTHTAVAPRGTHR
jgi:hypothetical protein